MKHFACALAVASAVTMAHPRSAQALFRLNTTRVWGDSLNGAVIPVCYTAKLGQQANFTTFQRVFRNAVGQSWGRAANITFTGWGQCPSSIPAGTVVLEYAKCNFNAAVGKPQSGSTVFTIDFNNADLDGKCGSGDNSVPGRWAYFAGHEFGHILGFEHEQDRVENPYFADHSQGCNLGIAGGAPIQANRFTATTVYDQASVMSYCGANGDYGVWDPTLGGWVGPLSSWDVVGAIRTYGKKPQNSLIGLDGKALTAASQAQTAFTLTTANWGLLQRWFHNGYKIFDPYFRGVSISLGFLNYLMDGSPPPAGGVNLYQKNQRWIMMGDKCIGTPDANTHSVLTIQGCGTRQYEYWDLDPVNRRIQLSGTNMCVNIPYGSATVGNVVQLYPCQSPPTSNEQFTFNPSDIRFGGLCFNVAWGTPDDGNWLQLYSCDPNAPNELYHFRGRLTTADGLCVQGTSVVLADACSDAADPTSSMTWDTWY